MIAPLSSRWFACLLNRVLLLFAVAVGPGVAPASAEDVRETRSWHKQDANAPSYFVNLGQGRWIETHENGNQFVFEELANRPGEVELIDRGRNLKLRLNGEFAELSVGQKPYQRWLDGGWVRPEDVPEYAQIAPIDHRVRLVYFVPTDREPTSNYREKINTLMVYVNALYQEEFRRRRWPDRGLQFQLAADGAPVVHLVRGKHPAAHYTGAPNYDTSRQMEFLRQEMPPHIGTPGTHLLVSFMETYDEGPHPFEWPGGIALGGRWSADGGMATFSAWILRDEFCATTPAKQHELFRDETPIQGRTALGHGRLNSPRFEFIEDGFGAVMHEVGHALGLPHDQREDRYYIMGNGFRQLRANFDPATPWSKRSRFSDDNARLLAVSRYLNPNADLTDQQPPQAEAELTLGDKPGHYRLKLTATDNKTLAALLCYDEVRGSVVGGADLEGKQGHIELDLPLKADAQQNSVRLRAFVADRGGQITTLSATCPAVPSP